MLLTFYCFNSKWHSAIHSLQLNILLLISALAITEVIYRKIYELASRGDLTNGLQPGRTELLKCLKTFRARTDQCITAVTTRGKEELKSKLLHSIFRGPEAICVEPH